MKPLLKYHPTLRDQPWERYRLEDGEKGPLVWEVKHTLFYPKDKQGLPGKRYHLVVAGNVLKPDEIQFFISNAPPETKVETLLLVGFSRWRVERCFQDQKSELGLDDYEGRRYLGLKRHLVPASVSYLFPARVHRELWGKKPELTVRQVHTAVGGLVQSWWLNGRASPASRATMVGGGRMGVEVRAT